MSEYSHRGKGSIIRNFRSTSVKKCLTNHLSSREQKPYWRILNFLQKFRKCTIRLLTYFMTGIT